MNKTVFIMDGIGNAVQWAAGMSIEAHNERGVVWVVVGPSTYTIHTADPRKCVLKFVKALCLCPDGSLLIWDEDEQNVVCREWREESAPVDTCPIKEPKPDRLPDGRPIIRVEGHPKWRELYDDEVIEADDMLSGSESFMLTINADCTPFAGRSVRHYRLAGDGNQVPYGKAYRRIKPKKQKAEESQP